MTNTITLKAQCHCGYASYCFELPKSAFPLKSAICHCNSCRHVSGQIFTTHAVIPIDQRPDVRKLTTYASSEGLTRHFCPKCGATIINFEQAEWEIATGVMSVEAKPEVGALNGLLDRAQLFVSDTVDGGGSVWLARDLQGKRYLHERASEEVTDSMLNDMVNKRSQKAAPSIDRNLLKGYCHCGNIKFTISRPDDGTRYGAGVDACMSCRKVSGFEITSWVTLDPEKISINDNGLDLEAPNISHYKSSANVHRYFCSICGATVFYLDDKKVENSGIDLAVGLLDSPAGVRAEDWLHWTKYKEVVAYQEDASDEVFVHMLVDGVMESRQGQV